MTTSLFGHLLLLLVMLYTILYSVESQNSGSIPSYSELTPTGNSSWLSPSGLFAFGFYPEGENRYRIGIFLAGLPFNKTVVWTGGRDYESVSDNATLRLTPGGLILEQNWELNVFEVGHDKILSASMLDSGNFVAYGYYDDVMVWQSFDNPTDTMLPGQKLMKEKELVSSKSEFDHSSGIFRLKMQSDFNLVLYPKGSADTAQNAYWATDTHGADAENVTLNLDPDGSLYLLDEPAENVTLNLVVAPSEEQRFYLMRIDSDGILRLYSLSLDGKGNSSSVVWQATTDRCAPKGLCGQSGYCSLDDNYEPKCECPPGYNYIYPGRPTAGCELNYTTASCNNSESKIRYSMSSLNNTYWDNNAEMIYHEAKVKEDCVQACLQDCECVVAFFNDDECSRQKIPLQYGRTDRSDSNIAYFKLTQPPPPPPPSPPPPPPQRNQNIYIASPPDKKTNIIPGLTTGVGAGLVVIVAVLVVSYWGVRQHRQKQRIKLKESCFKKNGGIMLQQLLYKSDSSADRANIYTEEQLKEATDNYNESNVIGQGGYGTVYKGLISNTHVAIKRAKVVDRSQIDQFVNEVVILSQINHPNVVKLLGCCLETPVPSLVYEYVTNNTLYYHIHDEVCASSVPWDMRLRIAIETAGALAHMHSAPVQIIHRDVKSANILLDDEFTAKVSDFGISRLFSLEQTRIATLVQGTTGYIDPEYFHSGILTQKSDVYSFGVVLAELLTGAKVVSFSRKEKDRNLSMYFLSALDDRLYAILEPRVRNEGNAEQLRGVAELAKRCLRIEGANRPTMKEVEEELVQLRELRLRFTKYRRPRAIT
ncbi:G-type lectin S-receptor-like serine/threonine-protein kinase LECRK3 [Apium graveolens]|uniref:G-type lectin S-receptor-like serine/threonine-protein kinase LECRK3 n=1 Tax=Apium graveolens TaxID=4045 RepID=UPI003D7B829C